MERNSKVPLLSEVEKLRKQNENLQEEIRGLRNSNDKLLIEKKQEGCFQVELGHLRGEVNDLK
jgi:uncharacterized protein YlxW (UPF0749 family)